MFDLFNVIISNINQNELNLALKNCDYFIEKYKTSISFIHSLIYLCISFIYNKSSNFELSENYFNKSSIYLNWLFPKGNCSVVLDVYYSFLSVFVEICLDDEGFAYENRQIIEESLDECDKLWEEFKIPDKHLGDHIALIRIYFKLKYNLNSEEKTNTSKLSYYLNTIYKIIIKHK